MRTPLSTLLLDLASAVVDGAPPPPAALALAAQLDQTGLVAEGVLVLPDEEGTRVQIALPPLPDGDLVLAVPGLSAVELALGLGAAGGAPMLEVLLADARPESLELRNLRVGLRFDPSLLRSVDGRPRAELQFSGGVRFGDWKVRFLPDAGLALSLCEIGRTGILVELRDVQLDLFADESTAGVAVLGLGDAFRGVYFAEGSLTVLTQARFGGRAGLTLELRDAAIGSDGVTCSVRHYAVLEHANGQIAPTSALVGTLFDGQVQLGVEAVELDLRQSLVQRFAVEGVIGLPLLGALFAVRFGLRPIPGAYETTVSLASLGPLQAPVGHGTLACDAIALEGTLGADSMAVLGTATGLHLDLDPLDVAAESAEVELSHGPTAAELRVTLAGVTLGPLGRVDRAELVYAERATEDGQRERSVQVECAVAWTELAGRLNVPASFPALPTSGEAAVVLRWHEDPASGARQLRLEFSAALDDVDALWAFVPSAYRPEVGRFELRVVATYADAAEFEGADPTGVLDAAVEAMLRLRLPGLTGLPGADLVALETGDADGWVEARLAAGVAAGEPFLSLELANPLALEVDLPGLAQSPPFLQVAVTSVGFDLTPGGEVDGAFILTGAFALRALRPPPTAPIGPRLAALFETVDVSDLVGTAALELTFRGDRAALALTCAFDRADLELDVFGLLAALTTGRPTPDADAARSEVSLDLEVGFGLRGITLRLGSLDPPSSGGEETVSFGLAFELRLAALRANVVFSLSDRELALGLADVEIPLALPRFPLTVAELAALQTDADWRARLDADARRIDELDAATDSASVRELKQVAARHFLLGRAFEIRERVAPASRVGYQAGLELVVGLLEAMSGVTHVESDLRLQLRAVRFVLPFADPRDVRVEGSAGLVGFAPADRLKALEGVTLTLGLSAERIFFAVDTLGEPIPLPDFGRYPGGSVSLSRLSIGYGFTRNSLSMVFAGEVDLPDQLQRDIDISRTLGFGILPPDQIRLGFRLDLIPVPAPVPAVPVFEFDLDMRKAGLPAIASTAPCEPVWDGFQLVVPNVIRADLKRLAFSPLFGILPIYNARFAGDLMLGDDQTGLTVVADDVLFLLGLGAPPTIWPVPYLAEPTAPYFRNLCVNLRLAGFRLNFNLQRPFPEPTPWAFFEVLGLIADPGMPIDPNGALANTIKVALTDATLTLPPDVARLFPEAAASVAKPTDVTINLGTFITALQGAAETAGTAADAIEHGTRSLEHRVEDLMRQALDLKLGDVLAALPPELRKVRLGGAFAGFEARAVLLVLDANDGARLAAEMRLRSGAPRPPARPALAIGSVPDPAELERHRPNLPANGTRTYDPRDPKSSLFDGIEFAAFEERDLAAIPPPRRPLAGIVVGAYVRVFGNQRFRFLGALFEDGSYGLVTALDVEPLRLVVAGIRVSLPFELHGRMVLSGRARRGGRHGSIVAEGYGAWNALPGVLRLEVASRQKPATLRLHGNGTFAVRGDVRVLLFGGAGVIRGSVDVSETHCFVEGGFEFAAGPDAANPLVRLALACRGRIGPGPRFELGGEGSLELLGRQLTSVRGVLTEQGAAVEATLDTGQWLAGGGLVDCRLRMAVRGAIDLRQKRRPTFLLEGEGTLRLFGARVEGRAGLRAKRGALTTFVEGRLFWQEREWLAGRVELGTAGVRLMGRTALLLGLTPSELPGEVHLASLVLKIDLEGQFVLDTQAGLASFRIKGDWQLAARLADDSDQVFPLASQRFAHQGVLQLELDLIHIQGFKLLPFGQRGDIQIPVPVMVEKDPPPDPIEVWDVEILGVRTPALAWAGLTLPPAVDLGADSSAKVGEVPLSYEFKMQEVDLDLDADLRVLLVWRDGQLKLEARS